MKHRAKVRKLLARQRDFDKNLVGVKGFVKPGSVNK